MRDMKQFCVYIMASRKDGAIYVGVTSNLLKRGYEHKNGLVEGHTKKYNIRKLVYFELHDNAEAAITREKQMKAWQRKWKVELIEKDNPEWNDLYETLT
jgi:putative endonuclease